MNGELPRIELLAYGAFGMPLAMLALPVYVYVPQLYSEKLELPLATVGLALLLTRILDAFSDPLIGAWLDRARTPARYPLAIGMALPLLLAGFAMLFRPPPAVSFGWLGLALLLAYAGFSLASVAHQSWGALLAYRPGERARLSAARETWGLAGVVLAAALPHWIGFGRLLPLFAAALALSGIALLAVRKPHAPGETVAPASILEPFRNRRFRWLFACFALNGIASATPATLFLFFAADRLQLAPHSGSILVLYFISAAASMSGWVKLARRLGEARAWLLSMLLAVAAFIWSYWLAPGALSGFILICALTGATFGADLALPPALLVAVMRRGGHHERLEGAYFGIWNWVSKMNLALAAGIALPLLQYMGYVPGTRDTAGIAALAFAYALLPCVLKLAAAAVLWRAPLRSI